MVFKWLKKIFYGLPFGLKGANTEIMGGGEDNVNSTTIKQNVSDNSVFKHMLKGEVTEAVEELRYRTYKIDKEANKYHFISGNISEKKEDNKIKEDKGIKKFSFENGIVCSDILTELKHIDAYGEEKYLLNVFYNSPVRFKMEQFIGEVNVEFNVNEDKYTTKFHITSIPNNLNIIQKGFLNELKKLKESYDKSDNYGINRIEITNSIMSIYFVTKYADGDEINLISYKMSEPTFESIELSDYEYILTYSWEQYERTDLRDKFFSKTMEEKYLNRAVKEYNASVNDRTTGIYCSKCGTELNKYEVTIYDNNGEHICTKCLINSYKNNNL